MKKYLRLTLGLIQLLLSLITFCIGSVIMFFGVILYMISYYIVNAGDVSKQTWKEFIEHF